MIECILPCDFSPCPEGPCQGSYSYRTAKPWSSLQWSDECCEDVVAKCRCYEDNFEWLQNIGFEMIFVICEDKINLDRPPPVLEWQDVEIWFGIVRVAHFTLREWITFQGRVRRILEDDDRDGHQSPPEPHTFFTTLRGSNFWSPATKSARVLYEQIHWILAYRQRISLRECKMLEDMSAALAIRSNPHIELRFKSTRAA